jgi:hypothetical protein
VLARYVEKGDWLKMYIEEGVTEKGNAYIRIHESLSSYWLMIEKEQKMLLSWFLAKRKNLLSDSDLRELVVYIKENRPEILRDIMCDSCPEVC